jgi:hypothetical protein
MSETSDYGPLEQLNDLAALEAITAARDRLELQAGLDGETQRNGLNKRIFDLRQTIDARLTPPEPTPDAAAVAQRDRARHEAAALHASLDEQLAKATPGSAEWEQLAKDKRELLAAEAPPDRRGQFTWGDLNATASTQHWTSTERQRLQASARVMGLEPQEAILLAAGLEDHRGLSRETLDALPKITVSDREAAIVHGLIARLPQAEQERLERARALRNKTFVAGMLAAVRRQAGA